MAILKIIRSSARVSLLRKITIYVNGQKLGTISNGQTKDFHIIRGQYILYAKIDWIKSNPVTFKIEDNETIVFKLERSKNVKRIFPYLAIISALFFITGMVLDVNLLIWIGGLMVPVYTIYQTTISKEHYLTLEQLNC